MGDDPEKQVKKTLNNMTKQNQTEYDQKLKQAEANLEAEKKKYSNSETQKSQIQSELEDLKAKEIESEQKLQALQEEKNQINQSKKDEIAEHESKIKEAEEELQKEKNASQSKQENLNRIKSESETDKQKISELEEEIASLKSTPTPVQPTPTQPTSATAKPAVAATATSNPTAKPAVAATATSNPTAKPAVAATATSTPTAKPAVAATATSTPAARPTTSNRNNISAGMQEATLRKLSEQRKAFEIANIQKEYENSFVLFENKLFKKELIGPFSFKLYDYERDDYYSEESPILLALNKTIKDINIDNLKLELNKDKLKFMLTDHYLIVTYYINFELIDSNVKKPKSAKITRKSVSESQNVLLNTNNNGNQLFSYATNLFN